MKLRLLFITFFLLSLSVFAETASPKISSGNAIVKPEYIIPLLTAILTILSSGVVAACVSHRLAKNKEELFYKRKKLEELYKSIEGYTTLLFVMNHMWLKVMDGELSFNQGLDLQIDSKNSEEKKCLPEIDMLINLYFPKFLPTYENFIKKRDTVNKLYNNFRNAYKEKGPTIDYGNNRKEFSKALLEIDEISKVFLKEVAQHAQKLK